MHDFYVSQLHHHSPHATMHTIHAIYFFSGLSRSWWSRGAASVARIKRSSKPFPFFHLLSYICRNCIQIIPKEYPAKTHIFESRAFSFAFMHKWKVRLMPAFFEHFFKCTIFVSGNALRIIVSHTPIRLLVPGQVFFFKGRQHAISRLFKYH